MVRRLRPRVLDLSAAFGARAGGRSALAQARANGRGPIAALLVEVGARD